MRYAKSHKKIWPRRNLRELILFLENQYRGEIPLNDLSSRLGMSVQNISAQFCKDDMWLSKVEAIYRAFGQELNLYFPQRDIEGLNIPEIKYNLDNAGNLWGLAHYMNDSKITINYMSQRIKKSAKVIKNAFETGDIRMSTLYEITNNLNIQIIWKTESTKQ